MTLGGKMSSGGLWLIFVGVSPGTQTVVNEQWRDGRASSVRAGIKQVPDSAVAVVLLGLDQPRPSALIRAFVAQWRVSGQAIGVATHQGVEGHPVVFSKRLFGALGAVEESSLGLRAVLERNRADVARIEMGTEDVWLDLNSPADYEAALANRREDS